MTEYTDNYGLNKYSDGDAANLRDQYNASMDIIDSQLKTANDNASHAKPILDAAGLTDANTASASKTRWDGAVSSAATNKTDIATINANLNALHANSVTDAQNLYNTINRNARGHHMVFIGDSITVGYGLSSPTTQSYPYLLSEQLGMTPHVYAQSGAGFVQASTIAPYNTLSTLAGRAVDDDSFQHSDVEYVMLMGGINDGYEQATQAATNATSALRSLKASFPNAEIYFGVCPTCGISRQNSKKVNGGIIAQSPNIETLTNVALSLPWVRIIDAWGLLWFNVGATDDGLHPNANGHRLLTSCLLSIMDGGQAPQVMGSDGSLWLKGGATRNITRPEQYPTDAYSQSRYEYAKTHVTNVRALDLELYAESPTSLTCQSNLSLTFTVTTDSSPTPSVFYFPISKLPTFTYLYRPSDFWQSLGHNAVIYLSKILDNLSKGTVQALTQYNYINNCVEVGVSMANNQTFNTNIIIPQFSLPMVNYRP